MSVLDRIKTWMALEEAELSHRDIARQLRSAIDAAHTGDYWIWLKDTFDDRVIYEITNRHTDESALLQRSYSIDEDSGKVTLGDAVQVRQVTTYEPIEEAAAESAGNATLTDEIVPLIEKAVADDGTVPIKVIAPGWGSSGYYSPEVLQNAAGVIPPGTHMYIDHPTVTEEQERPERSVRDLAAITVEDAVWQEEGAQGPGLYTRAQTIAGFGAVLDEIAPHIGVSIRGRGRRSEGEVEGQKGLIVNSIEAMDSIDFVTLPGAGGAIGELVESARSGQRPEGAETVTDNSNPQAQPADNGVLEETQRKLAKVEAQLARSEARAHITDALAERRLPEAIRAKLMPALARDIPLTEDGEVDTAKLDDRIEEAVKAELAYLEQVAPTGRVTGFGGGPIDESEVDEETLDASIAEGFAAFGLSESAAKRAAAF